jgi:hypothetical protein
VGVIPDEILKEKRNNGVTLSQYSYLYVLTCTVRLSPFFLILPQVATLKAIILRQILIAE